MIKRIIFTSIAVLSFFCFFGSIGAYELDHISLTAALIRCVTFGLLLLFSGIQMVNKEWYD